jgi:hypothetical protein
VARNKALLHEKDWEAEGLPFLMRLEVTPQRFFHMSSGIKTICGEEESA